MEGPGKGSRKRNRSDEGVALSKDESTAEGGARVTRLTTKDGATTNKGCGRYGAMVVVLTNEGGRLYREMVSSKNGTGYEGGNIGSVEVAVAVLREDDGATTNDGVISYDVVTTKTTDGSESRAKTQDKWLTAEEDRHLAQMKRDERILQHLERCLRRVSTTVLLTILPPSHGGAYGEAAREEATWYNRVTTNNDTGTT